MAAVDVHAGPLRAPLRLPGTLRAGHAPRARGGCARNTSDAHLTAVFVITHTIIPRRRHDQTTSPDPTKNTTRSHALASEHVRFATTISGLVREQAAAGRGSGSRRESRHTCVHRYMRWLAKERERRRA
eukprot:5025633-Prymnesium_polylepis.1